MMVRNSHMQEYDVIIIRKVQNSKGKCERTLLRGMCVVCTEGKVVSRLSGNKVIASCLPFIRHRSTACCYVDGDAF